MYPFRTIKRDVENTKAYLAEVEGEQRKILLVIRRAIRKVMPKCKEGIQYGMLDYPGLANLAAQKHYVALYVMPKVLAKHRKELGAFEGVDAGKSCLRFKRLDQVDRAEVEALLRDILIVRRADS